MNMLGVNGVVGGTKTMEAFAVSSTSVTATAATAVINFGGGAAADVVGQMVNNPGGPINYTEAGISGTVSSAAGFGFSQGPIEEHLPPQVGTGTLNQLSNFGTRSASGLLDFAVTNNRGLVGGALTGGGVPSEQSYFMGPGPHTVGGQSGAVLLV